MCINGLVDVGWLNLKSSAMYNCSKALPGRSGSGLCQLLTTSTWPGTAMGCWGDRWIRSKWHCSKMIDLNMTYYNHKHYTHIHTHILYKICLSVHDMVFADTYIQTDRQSDRHTHTYIQKVRQTYRQTYIHTDIQANIHTDMCSLFNSILGHCNT